MAAKQSLLLPQIVLLGLASLVCTATASSYHWPPYEVFFLSRETVNHSLFTIKFPNISRTFVSVSTPSKAPETTTGENINILSLQSLHPDNNVP